MNPSALSDKVKAIAAFAVAAGVLLSSLTGSTPEWLTVAYIDRISAAIIAALGLWVAVRTPPVDPTDAAGA